MSRQSNSYTFTFAIIICVVCAVALSLVSEGLRPKKEMNVALDIKKNILKAVVLKMPLDKKASAQRIMDVYKSSINEMVINSSGDVQEGKVPADIVEGEDLYPVYIYKDGQRIISYAFPIQGKGLWSTLYGYLALESDAKLVRGITFYAHGETPGLGAEIDKDWFQNNFKGKSVWDEKNKKLFPISVVKGKVADFYSDHEANHYVDGISGATMTSRGVTALLDKELRKYEPYFAKIRKVN